MLMIHHPRPRLCIPVVSKNAGPAPEKRSASHGLALPIKGRSASDCEGEGRRGEGPQGHHGAPGHLGLWMFMAGNPKSRRQMTSDILYRSLHRFRPFFDVFCINYIKIYKATHFWYMLVPILDRW